MGNIDIIRNNLPVGCPSEWATSATRDVVDNPNVVGFICLRDTDFGNTQLTECIDGILEIGFTG